MNFKDRVIRIAAYQFMPHFTVGVICLVSDQEGRFMMVQQSLRQRRKWGFPGGFVRRNETPEEAVVREVREECGLSVVAVRSFLSYRQPWARHYDLVFTAQQDPGKPPEPTRSREVSNSDWISLNEAVADLALTRETCYLAEILKERSVGYSN